MSEEKPAFGRWMELVQQGVEAEDVEYQKLYHALSPEKRDLVDSARREVAQAAN